MTKPGGLVVASDIDGGTAFFNSRNTKLAEALAVRLNRGLAQGWMGRRQQRYLVEAGLAAPPGYVRPSVYTSPRGPDPRVERITANLLERMRVAR